jgi:hypothetical protein
MTGNGKRVYFHEENMAQVVCLIPNREELTPEDMESLYFAKPEYQLARAEAKALSREAGRVGLTRHLDKSFNEKNKGLQEQLNMWTTQGDACRGLERWCNREHGEKRQQDQFTAVMTVLQVQDDMLNQKSEIDAEALRKASHKATRTARHFARMMGKADSHVVSAELGDDESTCAWSLKQLSLNDLPKLKALSTNASSFDDDKSTSGMTTDSMEIYNLPQVDELKDSFHPSSSAEQTKRRSRFNFGRKRRNKIMAEAIAVP